MSGTETMPRGGSTEASGREQAGQDESADDRAHMAEALSLAERGRGFVSPNPVVGAVVVRDGTIVGRGWHGRYGAPHAETIALREAGELARGAALYVTLEPCCVWGNTPPCTDAIIESGIAEVVFALEDPNPEVCGGGMEALASHGVRVRSGLMEKEATAANAGYLRYRAVGLPQVLLKMALSLDGRAASPPGGPRWTSSEESRERVHSMRASSDCVMVGAETVLADDPRLTDRRTPEAGRQPWRLVLDSSLRTPGSSALASDADRVRTIVACREDADGSRERTLAERGIEVWRFPGGPRGVDVASVLRRVADEGALYVLAEGGPRVAAALLREGLADRLALFVCPVLYGRAGLEAFGDLPEELGRRGALRNARWTRFGDDMLFEAEVATAIGRR